MQPSDSSAFERRGYPRFAVAFPVRLRAGHGAVVTGVTEDIALKGVQVRCSRDGARALCPDGTPQRAVRIDVQVFVPAGERTDHLDIRCQLVHLSLIPDEPPEREVALGLLFEQFANGTEATFHAFIDEQMRPPD